jgi:20S proteasome alpha/beta subunit
MTIALGLVFQDGIMVAADTNEVLSDGSKRQTNKVRATETAYGCFGIAHASEDGNAAKTLVSHIISDLEGNKVSSWPYFESLIADRMSQWASVHQKPPSTQLVIGGCLRGFGMALYFCEPPNSVVLQQSSYLAVGSGASVTDPLYKTLFYSLATPLQARLVQLAYLMYRAKEDNALCGGKTIAVIVSSRDDLAFNWIPPTSMEKAETTVKVLDYFLKKTVDAAILPPTPGSSVESECQRVAQAILQLGTQLRELRFDIAGRRT